MNMKRLIAVASLLFIFAPTVTLTSEGSDLKEIMQSLRNNLVDISAGLLMDDSAYKDRVAAVLSHVTDTGIPNDS